MFVSAFAVTRNIALAAVMAFLFYTAFSRKFFAGQESPAAPASSSVSLVEAYALLGLPMTASEEEVQAAYRRLMKRNHPDQGGSNDVAARLNQAKAIILKHLRQRL